MHSGKRRKAGFPLFLCSDGGFGRVGMRQTGGTTFCRARKGLLYMKGEKQ